MYIRFLSSFPEYHEWSAALISTYLRRGPHGYFRSECCTGNKSQHRAWSFHLHPPINAQHEAGQAASTVYDQTGKRTQLSTLYLPFAANRIILPAFQCNSKNL